MKAKKETFSIMPKLLCVFISIINAQERTEKKRPNLSLT
jgi:hypothetical protein